MFLWASIRNRDGSFGKIRFQVGGALGQQKIGAVVKVVRDSQCQPGPDCREYDAGS